MSVETKYISYKVYLLPCPFLPHLQSRGNNFIRFMYILPVLSRTYLNTEVFAPCLGDQSFTYLVIS